MGMLAAFEFARRGTVPIEIRSIEKEAEVAKSIGVTRQRVTQIKAETISEVRQKMQNREAWGYRSEGAVK